jgi:hypothetical protein
MGKLSYINRLSVTSLPLVQVAKVKCLNVVRFVARPLRISSQFWSCQSLFDRHTIRFGSVQSAARARARTEAILQLPEASIGPVPR